MSENKGCVHVWVIESTFDAMERSGSGKYSVGKCSKCDAIREDFNNIPSAYERGHSWRGKNLLRRKSAG